MKNYVLTTIKSLEYNGFSAKYFVSGADASDWLAEQVPEGQEVSFGGSVTLRQIKLEEKLAARNIKLNNHWQPGLSEAEREISVRKPFSGLVYFSSANAITKQGEIVNVDGNGNRVAATIFGPKQVYIVVGENKICDDIAAAFKRIETIAAPKNATRLNKHTPCVEAGHCCNCNSPERICNAYAILKRPTSAVKTTVVIIGEELGY